MIDITAILAIAYAIILIYIECTVVAIGIVIERMIHKDLSVYVTTAFLLAFLWPLIFILAAVTFPLWFIPLMYQITK